MFRMLGGAITRTNVEQQNVVHVRTPRLRLIADPPQKVVVDGEIVGETPIEVECIPAALTVLVPRPQG
jgi:diacylglycerol kinase family enzyme